MYHQLTSEQRSQIFVLLQKKIARKEIALLIGCSQSTLSREIRRNSTERGNYLWDKAHKKAMERRKRSTANSAKDPAIVWEALDLLRSEDWSPQQIEAYMKERGRRISHELIYRLIRADASGELASHCRHKMKYNRHGRPDRTTKVRNIPERVSIHQRPPEADGTRFGDWEIDNIVGALTNETFPKLTLYTKAFDITTTGIDAISTDETCVNVENGCIVATNCGNNTMRVYGANGALICTAAPANGVAATSQLLPGIYVVAIANTTTKVVVK